MRRLPIDQSLDAETDADRHLGVAPGGHCAPGSSNALDLDGHHQALGLDRPRLYRSHDVHAFDDSTEYREALSVEIPVAPKVERRLITDAHEELRATGIRSRDVTSTRLYDDEVLGSEPRVRTMQEGCDRRYDDRRTTRSETSH